MANTPGAKKSIRKIARRTEVNKARRSRVRTYLRKFEEAAAGGDIASATAAFVKAQSELMRAVTRGVVHANTGSRKVSRLAAGLKKRATPETPGVVLGPFSHFLLKNLYYLAKGGGAPRGVGLG